MVWAECQAINVLFRVTDERRSERERTRPTWILAAGETKWHRSERESKEEGKKTEGCDARSRMKERKRGRLRANINSIWWGLETGLKI